MNPTRPILAASLAAAVTLGASLGVAAPSAVRPSRYCTPPPEETTR